MDVVDVNDFGTEIVGGVGYLVRVDPAAQQCAGRVPAASFGARALQHVDVVAVALKQPGDIGDRALLSPPRAVSVVQQQDAHQSGAAIVLGRLRPCRSRRVCLPVQASRGARLRRHHPAGAGRCSELPRSHC